METAVAMLVPRCRKGLYSLETKVMESGMKDWQRYERAAQHLLNEFATHFDLGRVECKQKVLGRSGTEWEIDAKGVKTDGEGFLVVECKRWTSRLSQEDVGALVYKITDTGASGGILVTPIELQRGARQVANHENIHHVVLDKESTTEAFVIKFLGRVMMGVQERIGVSDWVEIEWTP